MFLEKKNALKLMRRFKQGLSQCRNDIKEIIIPEGVTTIGKFAFYSCTSLALDHHPRGCGDDRRVWVFCDCTSLVAIALPDGVTSIGWCAFEDCTSLASITLPETVTTIEGSAFQGLLLARRDRPPRWGDDDRMDRAFFGCASLVSIILPEGVTVISQHAFQRCTSLASITLSEETMIDGFFRFHRSTKVLRSMHRSPENYKLCDDTSKGRIFTILLCLCRLEIPTVVLRRFLNFLDLTRMLET